MSDRPSMSQSVVRTTYRGVWAVLRTWFRVPDAPPTLPIADGAEAPRTMRPDPGFLRYLTFQFWLLLILIDVALIGGWLVVLIVNPLVGAIIAIPVWIVAIVPDIVAYVAIHLRYDSTWYVLSDRSMRLRRGIWIIEEVTISFDNVQNVSVHQGPLQRYFGIANVVVSTAGGGVVAGPHGAAAGGGHVGLLEGVGNADELRDLIMARVRLSRSAGLGDDFDRRRTESARTEARPVFDRTDFAQTDFDRASLPATAGWRTEHVACLRAIRDELRAMSG